MVCKRCKHDKKSHRNRPYGRSVIHTWCHKKGCDCKSYQEDASLEEKEKGCGRILSKEKEITVCCGDFGNLCEKCMKSQKSSPEGEKKMKKFIISKVGEKPSLKELRKELKSLRRRREDFKKKDIAKCHVCNKSVINKKGTFELGTVQIGSDDGILVWSFHKDCYDKYKNHFCRGEEVWMPICKECEDEEKRIIKEFNKGIPKNRKNGKDAKEINDGEKGK